MCGSLLCSEGTFFFFLILLWNEGPFASKPNIENTALFIWRISVGPSFQNHYFIPSKLRDMHSENTLVITSVCLRTVNRKSMDLRQKCNDGEVDLSAKPPSHSPASVSLRLCFSPLRWGDWLSSSSPCPLFGCPHRLSCDIVCTVVLPVCLPLFENIGGEVSGGSASSRSGKLPFPTSTQIWL